MAQAAENHEIHLDSKEARWFAVYTKYKREKLVRQMLERKGIEVYLPINKVTRRWTRKVKKVELPLISCYVFVKILKSEYIKVLETENVLSFVRFSKNLLSIPEKEIELMKRITGEIEGVEVTTSMLNIGDDVEIIAGNLTGLKGKLIKTEGNKKFVVELISIGYSLQMEIDPKLLRKKWI